VAIPPHPAPQDIEAEELVLDDRAFLQPFARKGWIQSLSLELVKVALLK